MGALCLSLFRYALLYVHSSFAIILKRKRKLVALLVLSYRCFVSIKVLWLFLTVPWVGLQYVIVVFHDHAHFLIVKYNICLKTLRQQGISEPIFYGDLLYKFKRVAEKASSRENFRIYSI